MSPSWASPNARLFKASRVFTFRWKERKTQSLNMYSPSEMRRPNFRYEFLTRGMIDGLAQPTGLTVWRSATDGYDSPSTRFSP